MTNSILFYIFTFFLLCLHASMEVCFGLSVVSFLMLLILYYIDEFIFLLCFLYVLSIIHTGVSAGLWYIWHGCEDVGGQGSILGEANSAVSAWKPEGHWHALHQGHGAVHPWVWFQRARQSIHLPTTFHQVKTANTWLNPATYLLLMHAIHSTLKFAPLYHAFSYINVSLNNFHIHRQ